MHGELRGGEARRQQRRCRGWAGLPPPLPHLPPTPRSVVPLWVWGARSFCWRISIHPSVLLGTLFATSRAPLGRKGQAAGGGGERQKDTGLLASRTLSRSRGGEAAAGWGRARPSLPRGREGKGRGEGGGCPAVPGRGACSRPWGASGRTGMPQRACALENFVPCLAGGRAGPSAGRAGNRSPGRSRSRGGEVGRGLQLPACQGRPGTGDGRATGLVAVRPFVWQGKASPPPLAGCWEGHCRSRRVCPALRPQAAVAAVCLSPETAASPFPWPGLLRELEGGYLQGHPPCWCSQKKRESFPCSFFPVVSDSVASPLQHTDKRGV